MGCVGLGLLNALQARKKRVLQPTYPPSSPSSSSSSSSPLSSLSPGHPLLHCVRIFIWLCRQQYPFRFSLHPGSLLLTGLLVVCSNVAPHGSPFLQHHRWINQESLLGAVGLTQHRIRRLKWPLECAGVLELLFGLLLCEGCRFLLLSHNKACQRLPCLQFPPFLWWTWSSTSLTTS